MNGLTPSRDLTLPLRLWGWFTEGVKLFAIAVGCLAAFAIVFFVWVKTGLVRIHLPASWFFFFFWTCFLLWFVCRQLRQDLKRGRFWVALFAILAVHIGAFVIVLKSYPEWHPVWFMFTSMIEAPLMTTTVESIVHNRHRRSTPTSKC